MAGRTRRVIGKRIAEKTRKSSFEEPSARSIAWARKSKDMVAQKHLKDRESFFDSGYWLATIRSYENSSGVESEFYHAVESFVKVFLYYDRENVNIGIEHIIYNFLTQGPVALHVAVSYFVSKGFIDAPRKVLIDNKLYDWAAAVEEGRGSTTNWESVIELYALNDSENHLRRLIREIPQRVSKGEAKKLLTLIREKLREITGKKQTKQ